MDIGRFSKRTILTGAGWTRNWGGKLAEEVWEDLIGHSAVRENPRLRNLLLDEPSFEVALGKVQAEFTEADRLALEQALYDVFSAMDRELARPDHEHSINICKVQELIFHCWGQRGEDVNAGYMFTLNQDLWPERKLYNEHLSGVSGVGLPGLQGEPNQKGIGIDPFNKSLRRTALAGPFPEAQLRKNFNVIKLHGSFNWQTADGRHTMVMGTAKGSQISASSLLSWYWQIFRNVLSAGDVRLMIVGYGFADQHVNDVIAEAVEKHGLKVFIWDRDTGSKLKERVNKAPQGSAIWKGLLSIATRPMIEVFPSNQAETEEYRRIKKTFFE